MHKQIIQYLKSKGYSDDVIRRVFEHFNDLTNKGALVSPKTKAASSPFGKLIADCFDQHLAEPLRQLKALKEEIKRDRAIVTHMVNTKELALAAIELDKSTKQTEAQLKGQDRRIDNLEIAIKHGYNAPYKPFRMGGHSTYEELREKAEAKRQKQGRCLW